ncbi:MAG: UDP-N-acetylmuramoyl-L-alanyl-D-glutamate--2,6-diaminopimelate ligase [Flavobacteriales bacterium]|nr:UDP-N-acetylmuramoyl-L-alanyl-D-glutamate--2,6-diaminopimelate ligase [Flavobacteriales bacterium]
MKLLKDILYRAGISNVIGSTHIAVEHIAMDSRQVKTFTAFVAVRGVAADGHDFIEQAIDNGAIAIICEKIPASQREGVTYVEVPNSAEALGYIASNFFDNPSENIKVVGVTGTNGKTTTATLLYCLARAMGFKAGLLSTVVNRVDTLTLNATHTTPDAISINRIMSEMVEAGCEFCFMEVSSHALHQHRTTGLRFAGALFTNITHDHLDYHKTFNEYIKTKKILFDTLPSSSFALVNNDDRNGDVMLQNCKAGKKTFALQSMADYKAKVVENSFAGLHLMLDGHDIYTKLIGAFNAYNLLGVYAVAVELGLNKLEVLTSLSTLEAPEGRFQYIKTKDEITAVIDYAHSPDALKNVLNTIREIRGGNEKVITVVGCGGDRDKEKRPVMARIAADMSDRVVLTSDNPRSEEPDEILAQMKSGLDSVQSKKTIAVSDRREAIKLACTLAQQGDIILIAGKGHENTRR